MKPLKITIDPSTLEELSIKRTSDHTFTICFKTVPTSKERMQGYSMLKEMVQQQCEIEGEIEPFEIDIKTEVVA